MMFPLKIKSCIQILSLIFALSNVNGQDRKINATLYPGCQVCTENDTLIYIRAEGSHDTIHQIWDFTRGIPIVILAVAGVNSSMNITWKHTKPINFTMSESPKYSFSTAIDKLYEYNDIHDKGYIDDSDGQWRPVRLSGTQWWPQNMVLTDQEVMLQVRGYISDHGRSGIVDIKLDMLPFRDYAVELPHLIHSANSSLLDVSLVNLTRSRDFNSSRYALNLLVVSQEGSAGTLDTTVRKSLDDEHTPGIFEIVEVSCVEGGGFLQFRPVCYTQQARTVASSARATLSATHNGSIPERSTLSAFYRGFDPKELLVKTLQVSFGEPGDGFYAHHNYTAWSSTVGVGSAPREGFSALVVGLLVGGAVTPAALLIAAGLYALVRR